MAGAGVLCQKNDLVANDRFNVVRYFNAALFLDVAPDLDKIERGFRRKNVARARSFRLGFQVRQVSIQLVCGDSLSPVELIDTAPNLGVDRFPVLQKPAILFLLGFKQAEQHFLDAAGAGRLELFLKSGLQGRIADFDVHRSFLVRGRYGFFAS